MTSMLARAVNDNVSITDGDREMFDAFSQAVARRVGPGASFAEIEVAGMVLGNDLCRWHQQEDLTRRAARWTSDELMIDGAKYRRHQEGSDTVHSLCGSFRIERPTYRQVGVHNGPTVVPLDLDAGLLSGATPALAFKLCEGYAQAPSRVVHKALLSSHRIPPSRSTTERIAKELGTQIGTAVASIEPVVRAQEKLPMGACGISLGLDRTTAPMEELLEGEALANYRSKRTKPYIREAPEPVDVKYRMAYVGTVSVLDVDGRALVTRRYGASAAQEPHDILDRMMADVVDIRSKSSALPLLPIGLVQDGALEMWKLMREALARTVGEGGWHEGIDRHHLLERLSSVLSIAKKFNPLCDKTLAGWNQDLDADDNAIDDIELYVADLFEAHSGEVQEELADHLTYIANNKNRMRYVTLRSVGLAIGSGPTEGACKSLVMVRAKGCGQRWHHEGLDAVLLLRGLDMSDRLAPVFELFAHDKLAKIRRVA